MAANSNDASKKINAAKFDENQIKSIMAVYAYMQHVNQNPDIAYIPHFETNHETPLAIALDTAGTVKKLAEKASFRTKENDAPTLSELLEMMLFIDAVLSEEKNLSLPAKPNMGAFKEYNHNPDPKVLNLLSVSAVTGFPNNDNEKENLRTLAQNMLSTLTRYRELNYTTEMEEISKFSGDKNTYDLFVSLHERACSRLGSGVAMADEGTSSYGSWGVGLLRLAAIPLYPIFFVVGGGVSAFINLGGVSGFKKLYAAVIPALNSVIKVFGFTLPTSIAPADRTSAFYALIGGMGYSMGHAGNKYWAQAGLSMPSWDKLFSSSFVHVVLAGLSMAWCAVAEFVGKSLLWPIKFIVGYDKMASNNPIRQFINGLENTLVGVLAAPAILFNNFYSALFNWSSKTFTTFKSDPRLQWLEEKAKEGWFEFDLKNLHPAQMVLLTIIKAGLFVFDTIPNIMTNTIMGSLRSILPAIPGTTREGRDKAAYWIGMTMYAALFSLVSTFLITVFLVGVGASLPGWLALVLGAPEAGTAMELFKGFTNSIANGVVSMGNVWGKIFTVPLDFMVHNLNSAAFMSQVGDLFSGIKIHNALSGQPVLTAVVSIVSGLVGAVALFVAPNIWKLYQEKKKTAQGTTEAIMPDDDRTAVLHKIQKQNQGSCLGSTMPMGTALLQQQMKGAVITSTPTAGSTSKPGKDDDQFSNPN